MSLKAEQLTEKGKSMSLSRHTQYKRDAKKARNKKIRKTSINEKPATNKYDGWAN
jgi:hypothetical protein